MHRRASTTVVGRLSRQNSNHSNGSAASTSTPEFISHVAVVRQQIKGHNRYTIDPRHSRWITNWDFIILMSMFYTSLVTPVEICLLDSAGRGSTSYYAVLFFNQVISMIFLLDLCINFFLAYQETPAQGGRWVTNGPQIRRHYRRGWFAVDFISVLPVDLLEFAGVLPKKSSLTSFLRLNRVIRIFKLIKTLQVLKGSSAMTKLQDWSGFTHAQVMLRAAHPMPRPQCAQCARCTAQAAASCVRYSCRS